MVFINKSLKHYREHMTIKGVDGAGKKLSEDDIMFSIKLFCANVNKDVDYEQMANEVNFDLDRAALAIARQPDAKQMIISIVDQKSASRMTR